MKRAWSGIWTGLACVVAASGVASAQPSLPANNKESYDGAERQQIEAFAAWATQSLTAGEPDAFVTTRTLIIEETQTAAEGGPGGASTAFRSAMAAAFVGNGEALIDAIAQGDTLRAVNAVLSAGAVADRRSVGVIEAALDDERHAVRIAAAAAGKTMITRLSVVGTPAAERDAGSAQEALAAALADEDSPLVARALVQSLVSTPRAEALQASGLRRAATAMADRARAARAAGVASSDAPGWLAAMRMLLTEVRRQLVNAGRGQQPDRGMLRDASLVAGIAMSMAEAGLLERVDADAEQIRAGGESATALDFARRWLALVGLAEQVVLQGEAAILGTDPGRSTAQPAIEDWIQGGGDALRFDASGFRDAVDGHVGEGGRLTRPPFSFESDEFDAVG